ncbi:glycosyl hydrolase family 76-domain-containing protein [Aspergillus karnatakaensis]|uniref:putative glycosyl hydrolase n=1 Tax=Aspergillus karnatakaensis TaxID=1810916 RepID=UPI003CCD733D
MLLPVLSITTLALSRGSAAQSNSPDTPLSRALTAANTLQTWYNPATGIWNTCGWWNGANCLTALANLASTNESSAATDLATGVFQNTFSVATNVNPFPARGANESCYTSANGTAYDQISGEDSKPAPTGAANATLWLDGSYDDDAWWGLAWIAAYDVTGDKAYLDLAEGIFYHLSNAWPSTCGNGGIDSSYTHVYVGAIANELFLALAGHLATRTANTTYYTAWAKRQWTWFRDSGLINENYTINDGLAGTGDHCRNNGGTVWTYNQGVILGGLVQLHLATTNGTSGSNTTSNSTYLDEASKIAHGAIEALVDDKDVLREPCETTEEGCGPDQTQFKGIFIRNLKVLHDIMPEEAFGRVINASADSIWENDRLADNRLGVYWAGPVEEGLVNASTHGSALDALVAAV